MFVAIDTRGPEFRIKIGAQMDIKADDLIEISPYQIKSNSIKHIQVANMELERLSLNEEISFDDNKLVAEIIEIKQESLVFKAKNDHILVNNKRIHFPKKYKTGTFLNDKDKSDILWALENEIDMIFLSYVESKQNLIDIRSLISEKTVKIISKIEFMDSFNNINEIISASDGIMVARGDLFNDPVIMATEMLGTIIYSPIPLRSEISDIGNAVLDNCYAVMLSGETANGKYPDQSVDIMRRVCNDAEKFKKVIRVKI